MSSGLTNQTVGSSYQGMIGSSSANLDNVTIGTAEIDSLSNCLLTNCSTDTLPFSGNDITNKTYVDDAVSDKANLNFGNNTFNNNNTFNGFTNTFQYAPRTLSDPIGNPYIGNRGYNDNRYLTKSQDNDMFGLDTWYVTPKISLTTPIIDPDDITNKSYVDGNSHSIAGYAKLNGNQSFTGVNQFLGNISSSGINTFTGSMNTFTGQIVVGQMTLDNVRVRLGRSSVSSVDECVSVGYGASSTTLSSIAIGANSIASGLTGSCTAVGKNAKARGVQSSAFGVSSEADHFSSTALGFNAQTTADYQTRIGCIGLFGNKTTTSIATDFITNGFGYTIAAYRDAGVYMINGVGSGSIMFPMWKSNPALDNATNQLLPTGFPFTSSEAAYGTPVGTWLDWNLENCDDSYIVLPYFGVVVYSDFNYLGTIRLNFYNDTDEAICVKPSVINTASSMRVFFNHVQL